MLQVCSVASNRLKSEPIWLRRSDGGHFVGDSRRCRVVETVEMSYDNHRLGHDQLLGGEEGIGNGLRWALSALELGRINVAARGVGVAQAAYDAALAYAKEREAFGRPISQHQAIAFVFSNFCRCQRYPRN